MYENKLLMKDTLHKMTVTKAWKDIQFARLETIELVWDNGTGNLDQVFNWKCHKVNNQTGYTL